jgi:hypothetical protein
MQQILLNIPDNKFTEVISLIKSKFTDVRISKISKDEISEVNEEEYLYLTEISLKEDWLSDEDNRWDKLL